MREYIFRGKDVDTKEWVYGGYCKHDTVKVCFTTDDPKTKHIIIKDGFCDWEFEPLLQGYEVDPETVGQYTGLADKNGVTIFEGDIVQLVDKNCDYSWEAVVVFGNPYGQYCWGWNFACIDKHPGCNTDILLWVEMEETGAECEVIGNIHDNKEILKEGGE